MAKLADVFTDPERTNWLKAWLAIDIAKSGLEHFAENEAKSLQGKIYNAILTSGAVACSCCHTANLLKCPSPGICKTRGANSPCKSMHDTASKQPRQCPANVCNKVLNEIAKQHKYPNPSWKNTEAIHWASNPWEIAKVYFPPDGYTGNRSAQDTDFNGIISFMMHCKHFDDKFSFLIAPGKTHPPCPLTKARDIGRIVRHSSTCKVTDTVLQDIFITLTSLLTDQQCLTNDVAAQEAVKDLAKLQTDVLQVTTQEIIHLLEAAQHRLKKAEHTTTEAIDENRIYIENCRKDLINKIEKAKQELDDYTVKCIERIDEHREKSKVKVRKDLNAHSDKYKKELDEHTGKCKEQLDEHRQNSTETVYNESCKVVPHPDALYVTRPGVIQCNYYREGKEPKEISSHVHDGRLVELRREYISHLKTCLSVTNPISDGGFGNVFLSHSEVSAFKQRVVLKEIDVGNPDKNKAQLLESVMSEKLASRLMHFAIVPLWAYHDDHTNGKFYFISPYFVNGDLYEAIKSDKNAEDRMIRMDMNTRLRTMYQVASAIIYMHTENSFRGTILHMDIKSKNIVLDSKLNARLIDFGLARELKEGNCSATMTTVCGTKGYFPTVQHKRLTQQHDCYNFGVVLRELLTGRNALEIDTHNQEMRKWKNSYITRKIQQNIWTDTEVTEQVVNISYECIRSIDSKDANYTGDTTFTSKDLYLKLERLMRTPKYVPKWMSVDNNRCDICLLNESVPDVHIESDGCPHHIKTCCACMRNSYINPVKCYDCGNDVKSIIGHGWGAILIAGHKKNGQEMFDLDIKQFGDAITSLALPAMCISQDNIEIIDSNKETLKESSAKIDKAFDRLDSKDIHTLVFLYSGHNDATEGFWLGEHAGENENYSMERINDKIQKREKIEQVIAFLDCCKSKPIKVRPETILIQFNASGQMEDATCVPNEVSFFTKYLLQAFTMKASGGECNLHKNHCTMKGDFITLGSLFDYLEKHRVGLIQMNPRMHLENVNWRSTYLAYNFAFKVEISFNVIVPQFSLSKIINVTQAVLTDFQTLKSEILFPNLVALLGEHFECQATANEFKLAKLANALAIEFDLASRHVVEIGNMEKLMLAWNSKRMLRCKLRMCERIDKGKPVVLWQKQGQHVAKMVSKISNGKTVFDLEELDHMIKSLENLLKQSKDLSEDLSEALDAFLDDVHAIKDKTWSKDTPQRIEMEFINLFDDASVTLVYLELK